MAIRTSAPQVAAILGDNYDSLISLTVFMETANVIVNTLVEKNAENLGPTLSDTLLELIERWLSAHCYAHADQIFAYKQTGNAAATFQGVTGMGLTATLYGQTAIILDTTGYLSQVSKAADDSKGGGRRTANILWLGTAT